MKQVRLFLLGLALAVAGSAYAADVLKVQGVEVAPGGSVALSVELENETTNLMGWQCDIVLPEGLSLAMKANGRPAASLGERFATTAHSISSSRLANGSYRFIATSMDGEAIPGMSGTLFVVTLLADDSLTSGTTLAGKVTNIEFNTQDNQKLTFEEVVTTVTVRAKAMEKCATPTIAYDKSELVFSCETEGVKFFSEVKVADAKGNESERVQLMPTYEISVYATKEGYSNSDEAIATIQWRDGRPLLTGFSSVTTDGKAAADANGDGTVDVADIATIISEMAAASRRKGRED